jgi:vanillate O-demethylase ferredoxin subunit
MKHQPLRTEQLQLRLMNVRYVTERVSSFTFADPRGAPLPEFEAGAHIDLALPTGDLRSYSLINDAHERDRYVIAVQHAPDSRGGSRFMHETLRVGAIVNVGLPANNFPLVETAERSVLIAGGIGITPILSMARRLASLGRQWELVCCARSRADAAFSAEIEALAAGSGQVARFHFDDEQNGAFLDLPELIAAAPGAHFYCCGPAPMLDAFIDATAGLPQNHVHLERFSGNQDATAGEGFSVTLARQGRELWVPGGKTILDVLLENGIDHMHSCREGICGTCETRVLEGTPDHRDMVLSAAEQAAGQLMMVCVSRCAGKSLVLDL